MHILCISWNKFVIIIMHSKSFPLKFFRYVFKECANMCERILLSLFFSTTKLGLKYRQGWNLLAFLACWGLIRFCCFDLAGFEQSWSTTAGFYTTGDSDPANLPVATSATPRDDFFSPRPLLACLVSFGILPLEVAANCSLWPWIRSDRPPCTRPFAKYHSHRCRSILKGEWRYYSSINSTIVLSINYIAFITLISFQKMLLLSIQNSINLR